MKLKKINLNSKKAQGGIFGLSFGMIWGIILIVFFFVAAFIGIRAFLNYQKNALISLFIEDFQLKVNEAWNSQSASFRFNSTLPAGVQYICLVNLSSQAHNSSNIEQDIFTEITGGAFDYSKNLHIYAPEKDYSVKWANIKHIDLSKRNPICIKVSGGKVSIKIERNFEDNLVSVSA